MRRSLASLALALGVYLLSPQNALALYDCTVSLVAVNLGSYSPLDTSPLLSTGSLTVTCTLTSGVPETAIFTAKLSSGLYAVGGSYTARRMQNLAADDYIDYHITKTLDGSCVGTNVWGDAGGDVQSDSLNLTDVGVGVDKVWTIFGCATGGQDVKASPVYSDTITVTIEY